MALNIRQVYEAASDSLEFDRRVSEERLSQVKGYTFEAFHIAGGVYNRAGIVTLKYKAEFTLNVCCDRCLKPFKRQYDCRFEHILLRRAEEENDDYIVTEGDMLDIDDIAVQDALLQLPAKLLCREDCKGLCITCGADLNMGDCGCNKPQ